MEITNAKLQHYAERHTTAESDLLKAISRETHAKILKARMLSGHLQGRLLAAISHMIRPRRILEIGTYTGYSAICLAEGMASDGILITIDINEELEKSVRKNFADAGLSDKIDYRVGDALKIISSIQETFDLVFIDADKENYIRYFDLVIDKVGVGGFIMADNVLWSGKVLEAKADKETRAIVDFNTKVQDDTRVENVLLPLRDGIFIIRKVSL
jgi:predicted O-methyltransferase YrrM